MNAAELLLPGGQPSRVWLCGQCRTLHNRAYQPVGQGDRTFTPEERDEFARVAAERCCTEKPCERCGQGLGHTWNQGGWCVCEACRNLRDAEQEAAQFAAATKLTAAEWDGAGMLYDAQAGRWHSDLEQADTGTTTGASALRTYGCPPRSPGSPT